MAEDQLHRPSIVACIWDFDKTLIPGYMETPLFEHFHIDERTFWSEVNALPGLYAKRGMIVAPDTVYLNHILTYVRAGRMPGLNNALLRQLGGGLNFAPGLPRFFAELREVATSLPEYRRCGIALEHYIVSTGLAETIRGSAIAPFVENIYGCEFIENPLPPDFLRQTEFTLPQGPEVSQVGMMVDNTIKTRFIFEINKGTNKLPDIDVNANIAPEDRRVPIKNMIYIADGPSDIPVFSIIKKNGGRAYAVYNTDNPEEFAQNDNLQQVGRVHAYGPANYTPQSSTYMWIKMHVQQICERIVREKELALAARVIKPPRHLHKREQLANDPGELGPRQETFFEEESN